jgi:transcriptional regulator with XRE-family HTH domain
MHKLIHSEKVKRALQERGWSQKVLAEQLDVSGQAVTLWLKGEGFPRPDKLLKLASLLQLNFADLVQAPTQGQPVVAFRRKAATKTTSAHIAQAMAMGALLKPLVPFLPSAPVLRTLIPGASTDYAFLQMATGQTRTRLGLGDRAPLFYEHLIGEFASNGAVIVPVLWGERLNHRNALHILLPQEQVTFIFLNLDTRLEDFKFWMAHELAHIYTPELAGKEEGEDFADAFADALLFPQALAQAAYAEARRARSEAGQIKVLQRFAGEHGISLFSVFCEVRRYAQAQALPPLMCRETAVHAVRTGQRGALVSEQLFSPLPPAPDKYIAATQNTFRSEFFAALQRMLKSQGTGAGYLRQMMDIPLQDAMALHAELLR